MSIRDSINAVDDAWTSIDPADVVPVSEYEHLLWLLVIATLVLDVATTTYGLQRGLSEANPLARRLFAQIGPLGAMLVLKGVVLAIGLVAWFSLPSRYRGFVPLGVALPWGVAGMFNLAMLARLGL
jgi:hypothetical protein